MKTKMLEHGVILAACMLVLTTAALPGQAVPVQLISARDATLPLPAGGDDNSVAPVLSPDGRYVLFASTANDLVPGGDNFCTLNVFLRDRLTGATTLVSRSWNGIGGGNGISIPGQVSSNGQFVVFQSDASNLVPNDTNGATDIFIRDMVAGTNQLLSAPDLGGQANGPSTCPVMTPDGRYVAFISSASNLVTADNNGIPDVFVRDRLGGSKMRGTNDLISRNATAPASSANPVMATPVITPDGRYVAFFSSAANLVPSVPVNSPGEIYVRDRVGGTMTWASTNAAALVSAGLGFTGMPAFHPQLSDDGRYVAFKAGSLTPTGAVMILRYDQIGAATAAVSTNDVSWYIESDDSAGPVMTPDGRFIAFEKHEGTVASGYSSIHLWDANGPTDTLVSDTGSGVPTNSISQTPVISVDGRYVAFLSTATNLVANPVLTNGFHVYRRDLVSATTQLVDVDTNGVGSSDETMAALSLSNDGRFVAFNSPDGSLIAGDNNHVQDVFVRDMTADTTELVSQRPAGVRLVAPDRFSLMSPWSLSADGRRAAFASSADDLVPDDTNHLQDVFVRDLVNGTNQLVSVGVNANAASNGVSANPRLSADGRYVVFTSLATNLETGANNVSNNIYRYDLQTGSRVLISGGFDGLSAGNKDSFSPVISTNGRYIAFLSLANNLVSGITSGTNTYWRDVSLGQTMGMPGAGIFPPSMSSDGRYVAYSSTTGIRVRDTQTGTDVYTNAGIFSMPTIDPSGTKIFYQTNRDFLGFYTLRADSIVTWSNLFSITTKAPAWTAGSWSDDGRWLTFVATTNLGGGDDGMNKVYLKDFQTGTLSVIGLAGPGTNGQAAASDGPVISGDGRFIAYRSIVTNTVIGDTTAPPNMFLLDRLTGSNTVLTTAQNVPGQPPWLSRPVISQDGSTVAFLNLGFGLVDGDLNRAVDAFGVWIDSDGDGIPDWWMITYFGHPDGQMGDQSLASDDADADGVSNRDEYLAGTSPVDPASVFRLSVTAQGDGTIRFTWPAAANRTYQVQYKANLDAPVWLDAPGAVSVTSRLGYYFGTADQPQGFYRVIGSY